MAASGPDISVRVVGLDRAIKSMRERSARLDNLKPALDAFAKVLRYEFNRALDKSKSPAGERFRALAPSTLARKKREGASTKPLIGVRDEVTFQATRHTLLMTYPQKLRPHIRGGKPNAARPPKRNPLPFEKVNGRMQMLPRLVQDLSRRMVRWVDQGKL